MVIGAVPVVMMNFSGAIIVMSISAILKVVIVIMREMKKIIYMLIIIEYLY